MEVLTTMVTSKHHHSDGAKRSSAGEGFSLSVVVPVYNSEQILPQLVERLAQSLPTFAKEYEVILVNDGSPDRSWEVIRGIAETHDWVRGIRMMRNFGQHNALLCGIRSAKYEITVTMDDDLQHLPEEIPILLSKLAEGYDVVYGKPKKERHGILRDALSVVTKGALSSAMGVDNIREISAFRALKTGLRDAFANYQSPNLLLDVLLSWGTARFTSVRVEHHPRHSGKSNYNFLRLFNQTLLIFTGFSTAPLRLSSLIGFAFALFGLFVLVYAVGNYLLFGGTLPGFTFLASLIALFSGAQMFALGILGEYLARMFNRTMERPTYVISETCGMTEEKEKIYVETA